MRFCDVCSLRFTASCLHHSSLQPAPAMTYAPAAGCDRSLEHCDDRTWASSSHTYHALTDAASSRCSRIAPAAGASARGRRRRRWQTALHGRHTPWLVYDICFHSAVRGSVHAPVNDGLDDPCSQFCWTSPMQQELNKRDVLARAKLVVFDRKRVEDCSVASVSQPSSSAMHWWHAPQGGCQQEHFQHPQEHYRSEPKPGQQAAQSCLNRTSRSRSTRCACCNS